MKTNTKTLIAGLSLISALAGNVMAQITLIDWGGTGMAAADTTFTLPTPTDNSLTRTWQYSASTALVATGGNYAGPNIYGALQTSHASVGPNNFSSLLVDDRGANDDYITSVVNTATIGDMVRGLVFFRKADFLNGSSDTLTFDSTTSATIGVVAQNGAGGNRGVRLAVLDGSNWYVSSSAFGGFSGSLSIADLSTATFASYNPTGAPLAGTPGSFLTAGSTFTDIQAVGYYFDLGDPAGSSGSAGMSISSFQITAIPEPSTFALMGLAGLVALFLRRRRN